MANYMSIKQMKFLTQYKWCELTPAQKKAVKSNERTQLGCFCKYGYTRTALYDTAVGRVLVESYGEYCDLLSSR